MIRVHAEMLHDSEATLEVKYVGHGSGDTPPADGQKKPQGHAVGAVELAGQYMPA